MKNKEKFKTFVKGHPNLLKHVQEGNMTWQKFYEMYDMYGEDMNIWNKYLTNSSEVNLGIFDMLKNADINSIQNGIDSMQRVISLFQDMTSKNNKEINQEIRPRPIYKHFED